MLRPSGTTASCASCPSHTPVQPSSRPQNPGTPLNVEKLKKRARKYEDKGQTDKAIATYREILDGLAGTPEIASELSLFNRVGDLFLKEKKVTEAVDMYERAVTLYSEHGFPNNAIALCNKILRNAPSRTSIYLKLAELMLERGFVAEAKQNLLEYADRMQKAGRTDEAFRALKEFADLSPDNEEIRLLLAEQLKAAARDDEAREQLAKLYAEAEATGDRRRTRATLQNIQAIDPEFDSETAPKAKVSKRKEKTSELIFLDLGDAEYDTDRPAAPAATAPPEEEEDEEPAAPAAEPVMLEPPPGDDAAEEEEEELEELEIERAATSFEETAAETDVAPLAGLEVDRGFETGEEESVEVEGLDIEPTAIGEATEEEAAEEEAAEEPALEIERAAAPDLEAPGEAEDEEVEVPTLSVGEEVDIELDADVEMEVPELDLTAELEEAEAEDVEASEAPIAADAGREAEDEAEVEIPAPMPVEEVPEPPAAAAAPPTIADLERAVAEEPDDAERHVALGEALIEHGDRERGIEELAIAVTFHEQHEVWSRAASLTDEILRLDPNNVKFHQKRVEYAYRSGERQVLTNAYLGLADALLRSGGVERAQAVYKRVLEHDPENPSARDALATFGPSEDEAAAPAAPAGEPAPAGGGEDFVDLGALILEDEPAVKDTRMRIQEEEPTGDEERDFADMLSQFKRGIEQNIAEEDWQAHYDLGIAFKEMGLVDEAIAEFQKALRSPAGRLKTAEALGGCFIDKEQYSVAATVMKRAVDSDPAGDEAKIGLLYWIGRCEEAQGRAAAALDWYQRVFALDINFQDVSERVKQLAKAGR